ncbi:MAG TPA: DUF4982 domain-containing protein [Candidatus Mediterraneibacter cottocaccae]|nr:DUF4982 domain-containing protein [Candidatus Mediterraneibacter cottocaccae]
MRRTSFNTEWSCYPAGKNGQAIRVELPFDAMQLDSRSADSLGGMNTGWYDAKDYIYEKTFWVPEEWRDRKIVFEFEGVYRKASVYINGEKAESHHYGYTGFYVYADRFLRFGENNVIRVEARNSDQPNSRWYTGTGLYRPVWLYVLPFQHISLDGIRVTTLGIEQPRIRVEAETAAKGTIRIEIWDSDRRIAVREDETEGRYSTEFDLPEARLWSPQTPVLYRCRVVYCGCSGIADEDSVRFGIRRITCTRQEGFCINGERVILKGACIHHDNGLLGACAFDFAEKRKVRLLKENGYNAIRSAHNPCSKALLDACDELGMLVMDEYVDMWYIHKTKYDYADMVKLHYKEDLKSMVDKDYNHPSVVMYSTGNEVSETAQKEGIRLCGDMTEYLHRIDPTRPVTCGVNIFFNFLSSIGFGVYSDKKAENEVKASEKQAGKKGKKKAVGSEFFNNLAGIMGSGFMKFGATLYPCDLKTKGAFAAMDVAGYNYGINRYVHDLRKYPERIIVGSETFCSDAYRFYELAKENPGLIGDFVWSGMDYLGEAGIGAWEYREYAPEFSHGPGWVAAGAGRIDLTGKPLCEMKYTQVAFGQRKIAMGVIPVNTAGEKHSPSAWKMTNAVESWSWDGCEGRKTKVEVYARVHEVRLYLDDECIGSRKIKHDCRSVFDVIYRPGLLKAAAFDERGEKLAETQLVTAGKETILTAEPEEKVIGAGDLAYVRLRFTDRKGKLKPLARDEIRLQVSGGKILACGSACPYYPRSYMRSVTDTYYGEALVIMKPEGAGNIRLTAESCYGSCTAQIVVSAG